MPIFVQSNDMHIFSICRINLTKFSAWPGEKLCFIMIKTWHWLQGGADGGWGVGAHVSLRAGLGPGMGLGYCLWLSFTQIADPACGNQKFGAQGTQGESLVGQRSYLALFAGEAASRWALWLLLGTGQYLGEHGCSHFGRRRRCLYWFAILCSTIAKQLTAVQICKTFLPLFCLLNWRQFANELLHDNFAIKWSPELEIICW